jgi:type VI secretion system protein ImpM
LEAFQLRLVIGGKHGSIGSTRRVMEVGLYGKLPSHGDFLRRRASDAFVDRWDAWLQGCMAASRTALGEKWLDIYLTSPAWRFVCAPGTCCPSGIIGLMVPSVDRVGRYFPLTLVAELPAGVNVISAAIDSAPFFDSAERLLIETLAAEEVDFETFDDRVVGLGDELFPLAIPRRVVLDAAAAGILNGESQACWQMPIGSAAQLTPIFGQLLSQRLSAMYEPLVVWWTEGSSMVEPSCLIAKGLPNPDMFGAMLDGSWTDHRWRSIAADVEPDPAPESDDTLVEDLTPLNFRSAAGTDVGHARGNNQDSFLEQPDSGLWVVADGLGGHRDGQVASRMVCDALLDLVPGGSFESTIETARERIEDVNEHLLRTSTRAVVTDRSASTVVVLLVRGARCAILWAGDSRVYRWRAGQLERLTRDHSLVESGAVVRQNESHIVTRAVGVEAKLALDLFRDHVRPGDRFLLCSDGLTRMVPDDQIKNWMANADIRASVTGLIQTTLDAGAPDNVTVVIVEGYADPV